MTITASVESRSRFHFNLSCSPRLYTFMNAYTRVYICVCMYTFVSVQWVCYILTLYNMFSVEIFSYVNLLLRLLLASNVLCVCQVLGQQVSDEHVPDVCLIGEMGDVTELGRLLQLVLGCAVSCDQKQEHIQQIMTLEESVQHVVMTAIQELLTKGPVEAGTPETYGDFDSQSRKYYFLSEETDDRDYTHRCRELQQQVSVLMEEKSSLQVELQSLRERLNRCETPDVSSTITNKKLLLLQSQMEQLQEENYRLDSSRDDLRVRADVLEREVTDLQLRNEELTSLAQEAQSLKDEMDILRSETRLEAMVETYKRKLEDLGDLRRQVRLLEERNHVYMQRTCELEEELRRANAIRSQLDTYKRQAHEMSAKHSAEAMKAEKWQFEYKNLNDKYETLLKEREKLIGERDALRETTEELRCAQVQQQCLTDSLSAESGAVGSLAAEIMPTELRDTVVRLQQENKTLCVQEESYRHRQEELQTQLEDSQRSQNTLETQNRLSQQQISELSALVEELQRALQEQDSKTEDVNRDPVLLRLSPSWPSRDSGHKPAEACPACSPDRPTHTADPGRTLLDLSVTGLLRAERGCLLSMCFR
uniref:HOOK N-terminal domain-containing protein n=1 Tax=Sinocyclocheilus rhinocerous TaxID=307959 RepID=A0A673IY34_9TELE